MDRVIQASLRSPRSVLEATRTRGIDWVRIEDWLTEHAPAAAATAEDELTLDWARYCARRRHEPALHHERNTTEVAQLRQA